MSQPESLIAFLEKHRLPESYAAMAEEYFLPLVDWLHERRGKNRCLLIGVNGAQGTGKSTLADFIAVTAKERYGWNVAALSLDDFYLTRAERATLAEDEHPLFATRGAPATHDTTLMKASLDTLQNLGEFETYAAPRFNKAVDDRAEPPWPAIQGPVDLIILEGWCVGTPPQTASALLQPVNDLEREQDPDRLWRRIVNEHLESDYADVFARLDALVFLRAPSFDAIFEWRLEQERKLSDKVGADAPGLMNTEQIREFINYYERLTRHNLDVLGDRADVTFDLAPDHSVSACRYNDSH